MVNGVVPADGQDRILLSLLTTGYLLNAKLHLFKTVGAFNWASNFVGISAREAGFPGYASVTLNAWNVPGRVGNRAVVTHPIKVFTATGVSTDDIQGYYVTDSTNARLLFGQNALSPIEVRVSGDTVSVVVEFTVKDFIL